MNMKYDVAIIGGGPAGYTAAEKAAKGGLSTVLFEKNALGGVCLNEGCVPTKTLLYSAKTYDQIKHASKYAVSAENPSFDYPKIIARKNKVVKKLTSTPLSFIFMRMPAVSFFTTLFFRAMIFG